MKLISEALKANRNIVLLNFSCNPLKDNGIKEFCLRSEAFSNLKEIILS